VIYARYYIIRRSLLHYKARAGFLHYQGSSLLLYQMILLYNQAVITLPSVSMTLSDIYRQLLHYEL